MLLHRIIASIPWDQSALNFCTLYYWQYNKLFIPKPKQKFYIARGIFAYSFMNRQVKWLLDANTW